MTEAREAAIAVIADALAEADEKMLPRWHHVTEARMALDALLAATQEEPCPTCAGYDYEADCAAYRKHPIGEPPEPCSVCNGSQRVPGAPLVLLGPEQVGWMQPWPDGSESHLWKKRNDESVPLFRAPFIEAQREEA